MYNKITIYILIDPLDGLVKYVGQTNRPKKRLTEHLNDKRNSKKNMWIKKLENLNLKPLFEIIDNVDKNEWVFWEQYYISLFKSWGFELKNMTNGGDGSYGVIPWNKGLKGKFKHSEESKKKMSDYRQTAYLGENNPFYGKEHSDESKKKISESNKGKHSNENIDLKGSNNPNSKKIYQYDLEGNFIREYSYGKETKKFGFSPHAVSRVCRGVLKTHKGYVFSLKKV